MSVFTDIKIFLADKKMVNPKKWSFEVDILISMAENIHGFRV